MLHNRLTASDDVGIDAELVVDCDHTLSLFDQRGGQLPPAIVAGLATQGDNATHNLDAGLLQPRDHAEPGRQTLAKFTVTLAHELDGPGINSLRLRRFALGRLR